ncbi:MAG: HAD family phosphatase [bacterium]
MASVLKKKLKGVMVLFILVTLVCFLSSCSLEKIGHQDIKESAQKEYTTIIFDLGGVLMDWNVQGDYYMFIRFLKKLPAMARQGKFIRTAWNYKTEILLMRGPECYDMFDDVLRGVKTVPEYAQMAIEWGQKALGKKELDSICKQDIIEYFEYAGRLSMVKPGGLRLLERISAQKRYKLYLLSNLSIDDLENFRQRKDFTDIFKHFDGLVFSSDVKAIKPEPEIFQKLLAMYNLKPEACFFIDDAEQNVKAAQKLGIDGIVYTDYKTVLNEFKERGIL